MLGTYVLSSGYYDAYYSKAQKVRALVKQDYTTAFQKCDAIVTPTSPSVAFKIGEKSEDPLAMYLNDMYTVSANLTGVPAISVPCGLNSQGLPIGLQLIGNFWSEPLLFNLAHTYERSHPLNARPRVFAE
jgi:aspartyl-tRNA(Asn)/glutamyl-tRNA(Gln) amidotransferase subunit A